MLKSFRFQNRRRFGLHLALGTIWVAVLQCVSAQGVPDIVWQTNSGGTVVAYSADGNLLLAGTQLFAAADGTFIRSFALPYNGNGPNSVAISPDEQYAAIGIQAFNQNLDLFRISDGALLAGRISAHSNGTTSVAFSPDGQLLASGGRDGTAKLWHLPDMTLIQTLNGGAGYRPRVFAVAFTIDGSMLAVGGQGGVVLYRVADGQLVREFVGAASTRTLAISPSNQFLASASNVIDQQGQCADCAIKIWRIADGALLETIDAQNDYAISMGFSPDQQFITAGSENRYQGGGQIRFWLVSNGALVQSYAVNDPNSAYVSGFAYSPNGSFFAFAGIDHYVAVAHNPLTVNRKARR